MMEPNENDTSGEILFNAISETCIKILEDPTLVAEFESISKEFENYGIFQSEEVRIGIVRRIVNILALTMTNSSYHSINWYDTMLKKELSKQMQHFADAINLCNAEIRVLRKTIDDMKEQQRIEEIRKTTGISDIG